MHSHDPVLDVTMNAISIYILIAYACPYKLLLVLVFLVFLTI
jgi:hypothetical protein